MMQARNLIEEEEDDLNLADRIMNTMAKALTEHAKKSLNVFHQVKGARHILERLKKLLEESHRQGLTRDQIRNYSHLFKGILEEADKFE